MISCVVFYTGRLDQLNESVHAFVHQNYTDAELVILTRFHLEADLPRVRIVKVDRPMLLPEARNKVIQAARGEVIVIWNEDDYYLPNHLSKIAEAIEGKSWVWMSHEFQMERSRIVKTAQGSENVFAFTKAAWDKVGWYQNGGQSDRNFIGRITSELEGAKAFLSPSEVTYIRVGTDNEKKSGRIVNSDYRAKIEPKPLRNYVELANCYSGGRKNNRVAVVELGRFGDCINLLGFMKHINDVYAKPVMVIAKEFANLLEGVSYCDAHALDLKNEDLREAINIAKQEFPICLVGQVWGRGWSQEKLGNAYNECSFFNCGIAHRFYDPKLKPVFDRRNPEREAALLAQVELNGKPVVLVNLNGGISSPCQHCADLMPMIQEKFGDQWQIVDLSEIKAERIYDTLAFYEKAELLISIDSAPIHLAGATDIKVIALTNPTPWAATIVRFNCLAHIPYDKTGDLLKPAIEKFLVDFNHAIRQRMSNEIANPEMSALPA